MQRKISLFLSQSSTLFTIYDGRWNCVKEHKPSSAAVEGRLGRLRQPSFFAMIGSAFVGLAIT